MYWSYLLHLGFNMWEDHQAADVERVQFRSYRPYLRCDKPVWDEVTQRFADAGGNQVVIDLGEGVQYDSHPELAVEGSWSKSQMRAELDRLRGLGLEPIPKLNFSSAHDAWLGPYERCLSTETYYNVCRELIQEVCELFDTPRLFHIGMDEETAKHQRHYQYVVIRQGELWWHDLKFLIETVEQCNVRPWMWSDALWRSGDAFLNHVPTSVLQSNWYYGTVFTKRRDHVNAYLQLEERGYDQIPTGSNHGHRDNLERTVKYCASRIDASRLHGFLQTPWRPTTNEFRDHLLEAADTIGEARAALPKRLRTTGV